MKYFLANENEQMNRGTDHTFFPNGHIVPFVFRSSQDKPIWLFLEPWGLDFEVKPDCETYLALEMDAPNRAEFTFREEDIRIEGASRHTALHDSFSRTEKICCDSTTDIQLHIVNMSSEDMSLERPDGQNILKINEAINISLTISPGERVRIDRNLQHLAIGVAHAVRKS